MSAITAHMDVAHPWKLMMHYQLSAACLTFNHIATQQSSLKKSSILEHAKDARSEHIG